MTAWWTAAARARESRRSDRLFNDPWAATLVGAQGLEDFDRAMAAGGAGAGDLSAIVTRFFDVFLSTVTEEEAVGQVVLVASGLDTRAFRMSWPRGTRFFELEQAHVLTYKKSRLGLIGATPRCEWHAIGTDLNEPWVDSLCRAGFDPSQRSVWLLEGVVYFLAEPAVLDLLSAITALTGTGSRLGLDVVNSDMVTCPSTISWNESMAAIGAPWLYTADEPEALLADFGWSAVVVQPGENDTDFGRYPYPLAARTESGVPRSLLVKAMRR